VRTLLQIQSNTQAIAQERAVREDAVQRLKDRIDEVELQELKDALKARIRERVNESAIAELYARCKRPEIVQLPEITQVTQVPRKLPAMQPLPQELQNLLKR